MTALGFSDTHAAETYLLGHAELYAFVIPASRDHRLVDRLTGGETMVGVVWELLVSAKYPEDRYESRCATCAGAGAERGVGERVRAFIERFQRS